jgi:hypothetical protein
MCWNLKVQIYLQNVKVWFGRNPVWAICYRQTYYACQESILPLPLSMWLHHYEEPFRYYCALRHEIHVRLRSDMFSNLPNVMFKADGNERGMDVVVIRNDVSSVINQQ